MMSALKIIIAGGRDFDNYAHLCRTMDGVVDSFKFDPENPDHMFIVGGAEGADNLGQRWCVHRKYPHLVVPARWATHSRSAGPIRNKQMIIRGATHLVAFWDNKSTGTYNMIDQAQRADLHTMIMGYA